MISELIFPQKGDKLFKPYNKDFTQNAIISTGEKAFILYSEGYKNAAIKVWESFDGSAGQASTLVYPLIFLNRHFLELRIKELVGSANIMLNGKFTFSKDHNLQNIWGEYRNLLNKLDDNFQIGKENFNVVNNLIREFNTVDPEAHARYSLDKKLNPTFQIKSLDLENFMETMNKLYVFFDSQIDMVYYLKDQIDEYNSIMAEELASSYYGY